MQMKNSIQYNICIKDVCFSTDKYNSYCQNSIHLFLFNKRNKTHTQNLIKHKQGSYDELNGR